MSELTDYGARRTSQWPTNPLDWCEVWLHEQPREFQPDMLQSLANQPWTAVAACRKAGKTRLAAIAALWFLTTRPNSLVVAIAPVWSQLQQTIWAEIRHVWSASYLPALFPDWEILTDQIRTPSPKWRALALSSDRPENIEGRHGEDVLVILDESKGISDDFFNSVQGMLGENPGNRLLAIGTPGIPRGWFYRAFSSERRLWGAARKVRSDEIPRLYPHFLAERDRLGELNPWFRQQQLAEFAGADEGSAIPLAVIEAAVARQSTIDPNWARYLAVDPAGRGDDLSVITFRIGPVLVRQESWQGWDEMRTARRIADAVIEFRPVSLIVDEVGIGAGIRSRCSELVGSMTRVIGYNGGSSPRDKERYMNRKAEDVMNFRERFVRGEIAIPNHPALISELSGWVFDDTVRGKTRVVDPSDSPDYADSALMAFSAESRGNPVRGVTVGWL